MGWGTMGRTTEAEKVGGAHPADQGRAPGLHSKGDGSQQMVLSRKVNTLFMALKEFSEVGAGRAGAKSRNRLIRRLLP